MASNRAEYDAALATWEARMADQDFSVPRNCGSVAILCPYIEKPDREAFDQWPAFEQEAYAVEKNYRNQGRLVEVALNAEPVDFKSVFCDPTFSEVVIIGHGCLSSVEVPNPEGNDRLDWKDLSDTADHLKTGRVIQSMCGGLPRKLNVPLGLMVVNDHRHVMAAVGVQGDIALCDARDQTIQPVTTLSCMQYEDIKTAFPQRSLPLLSRTRVALGVTKAALLARTK